MRRLARIISGWGVSPWLAGAFVTGILIVAVIGLLETCAPRSEVRRVEANNTVLKDRIISDSRAADDRLTDTTTINDRQEERANATATLPDTRPSDRRYRRGCVILRQQGERAADIPADCRP